MVLAPLTGPAAPMGPGVVQSVELNAQQAYYIPAHARISTTIRFPGPIGAPEGAVAVFTEDASRDSAEFLVTWVQGDPHLTVTPLKAAGMANLNVPYEGRTYVFYFYPVEDPLKAVASVQLLAPSRRPEAAATAIPGGPLRERRGVERVAAPPSIGAVPATPARLMGFLDRLKLLHAAPCGPALVELGRSMQVRIAVADEETGGRPAPGEPGGPPGWDRLKAGLNDAGLYQVVLLRAVRDERTRCVGFICLVRNTSREVLAFDVSSFGARAGAEYHAQRISDATPILKPGEQAAAYFVIQPGPNSPLQADNDWRISVDLVSPRLNPAAALSRRFAPQGTTP